MADRRLLRALLLAPLGLAACFDLSNPEPDDPRLLDRTCTTEDACTTLGSAKRTSGITSDSVGYTLGPGQGTLTIPFERYLMSGSFTLRLLMTGNGTVQVSMPETGAQRSFDVTSEHEWYTIEGSLSSTDAGTYDNPVELNITVDNDDSKIELVDIKGFGVEEVGACSVVAPGRRR